MTILRELDSDRFDHLYWVLQGRAAKDPTRAFNELLHVEDEGEKIRFVCTDGHRLHVWETTPWGEFAAGDYRCTRVTTNLVVLEPDNGTLFPSYRKVVPALGTMEKVMEVHFYGNVAKKVSQVVARYGQLYEGTPLMYSHLAALASRGNKFQQRWTLYAPKEGQRTRGARLDSSDTVDGTLMVVTMPVLED